MTDTERDRTLNVIEKYKRTDEIGRECILYSDICSEIDARRAKILMEKRNFGTMSSTLYEVVMRRLRALKIKVKKRRETDEEGMIYLHKQWNNNS
jgi:hypothetical protein